MLDANIVPIVILDGSFEEGKKKTLWKRSKEQLESALNCTPSNQARYSVMPIFAKDIFIQAIKSLGIEISQNFGEADRFIAHLASRVLSCPVLSNDSDFLIFESVQLIKISSIDVMNSDGNGIRCKIFARQKFLKFYGLESDYFLPLCGTLLGNDETSGRTEICSVIERIFNQVKKEKSKKSCLRHQHMAAILKWMGRQKSQNLDEVLDRLLQPVPSGDQREKARKLILEAVQPYLFCENAELCRKQICDCVTSEWENCGKFQKDFEKVELPSWCIDVIRNKHFYFQSQIEDSNLKSTISLCLAILYDIAKHLLSEVDVKITARGENSKTLSIIHLMPDLYQSFTYNLSEPFEKVLEFWCKICDVTKMELSAVILFHLYPKNEQLFNSNIDGKLNFDRVTVHSLSNFQAILYFHRVLWKIEGATLSLDSFPIENWSGLAMYNLIHSFRNHDDLCKTLKQDEQEKFIKNFKHFEPFTSNRQNDGLIPKRRRTKKTNEKIKEEAFEIIEQVEKESSDSDLDINNKFHLLSLSNQ